MLSHMMKGVAPTPYVPPNFTTWDPANKSSGILLSNGNLTASAASDGIVRSVAHRATPNPSSGLPNVRSGVGTFSPACIVEITINARGSGIWFGFGKTAQSLANGSYPGNSINSWGIAANGYNYSNGVAVQAGIPGPGQTWLSYGSNVIGLIVYPDPIGDNRGSYFELRTAFRTDALGSGYGPINWPANYPPPGTDLYFFVRLTGGAQITANFGASTFITSQAHDGFY